MDALPCFHLCLCVPVIVQTLTEEGGASEPTTFPGASPSVLAGYVTGTS